MIQLLEVNNNVVSSPCINTAAMLSSTMHFIATKEQAVFSPMTFLELFLGTPATETVGHKTSLKAMSRAQLDHLCIDSLLFMLATTYFISEKLGLGLLQTSQSSR